MFTIRFFSCLLLALSVAARPYEKRWGGWGGQDSHSEHGGRPWWTPNAPASYLGYGRGMPSWNEQGTPTCECNLQNALSAMSLSSAPTPLPSPSAGLSLFQVNIGRGTQNYTCDLANATATPVAVGALATLFNVSCIAADFPELLSKLPAIALDLPIPVSNDIANAINQDMSGHHYFLNSTTPFFNMDTPLHQYGMGAMTKINASDAPTGSVPGQFGQGYGATTWLMLDEQVGAAHTAWQQIYRLNTAGGNAPKTCEGQQAAFEIQYAAEYWLFQ